MRLIDADKLLIALPSPEMRVTKQLIEEAPTVDAEPVKHGMWKAGVTCSKCEFIRQETRSGNPMVGRYCPNCGARMDGNTNDET